MNTFTRRSLGAAAVASLLFFAQCGLTTGGSGATEMLLGSYEGARASGTFALFTISSTGLLTLSGTAQSAGNRIANAAINAEGTYAYAVNFSDNTISQFSVKSKAFSALTPATVATTGSPYDIVIHPKGTYAYVSNSAANTISQFSIDLNGTLTPLIPATVTTGTSGTNPLGLAITPSGTFLYAALNGGTPGNIAQFALDWTAS